MNKTKIVLLGQNSFIGNYFYQQYKDNENFVIDIVNTMNNNWKNYDYQNVDAVYYLAGIAHVSANANLKEKYYKVNRDLPIEIADYLKSKGVKQFIFMSSIIIYGADGKINVKKEINETNCNDYNPIDFYGDSKLQADLALQKLEDKDFKVAIIRCPMVYGEGCKGNFPKLIKASKKLLIFPNINNERSVIYIGNLVEFVKLLIENKESGLFYPQNEKFMNTSNVVRDLAKLQNKKVFLVKGFNWILKILSKKIGFINKVFGNKTYSQQLSNTFDYKYNIYNYEESLKRTIGNR